MKNNKVGISILDYIFTNDKSKGIILNKIVFIFSLLYASSCFAINPDQEYMMFLKKYEELSNAVDLDGLEMYADDAKIHSKEISSDGIERTMSMSGKKLKELVYDNLEVLKGLAYQTNFKNVNITGNIRTEVAEKAVSLNLEGVRAELGILRTARCAAAWRGDTVISEDDLEEAWILCLGHRQEQNTPTDHNSKPQLNLPELPIEKTQTKRIKIPRTSSSPLEAQNDKIFLDAAQTRLHAELAEWWNSPNKKQGPDGFVSGTSRSVPEHFSGARLCWISSLKASVLKGWSPGKPWRPCYRKPARRNNFWLFLDASRSTGVISNELSTRFLASVRNTVLMLSLIHI